MQRENSYIISMQAVHVQNLNVFRIVLRMVDRLLPLAVAPLSRVQSQVSTQEIFSG